LFEETKAISIPEKNADNKRLVTKTLISTVIFTVGPYAALAFYGNVF
jgi:hypothetical protein